MFNVPSFFGFRSGSYGIPFVGLLDTYSGAAAAYSLRGLSTSYVTGGTPYACQVRNSSNVSADIGFVYNPLTGDYDLDTASLLAHCGGGDGFIDVWYDQSGNGYDAVQPIALNQPQIVSSGSLLTDNSKPAMQFNPSNPDHLETFTQIGLANTGSIYAVSSINNTSGFRAHFSNGYDADIWVGSINISQKLQIWTSNQNSQGTTDIFTLNTQFLASYFMKSGTNGNKIYFNNSIYLTSSKTFSIPSPTTTNGAIGYDAQSNNYAFSGKMQEILFFADNEDTNNSGISTNINDFYSIYP